VAAEIDPEPVGWVERSETIAFASQLMGFATLNPSYELCDRCRDDVSLDEVERIVI